MSSSAVSHATCPLCPECGGAKIRYRRPWSSVLLPLGLFIAAWWLASAFTGLAAPVGLLLAIALLVLFGLSLGAILSAAFGSHRCQRCGTRWR
jgi:hypothetical protein